MSTSQKRSHIRISTLIFAGAAAMSVWMGAAYIDATATLAASPTSAASPSTQLTRN